MDLGNAGFWLLHRVDKTHASRVDQQPTEEIDSGHSLMLA